MLNRISRNLRTTALVLCTAAMASCSATPDGPGAETPVYGNRVILDISDDAKGAKTRDEDHVVVKRSDDLVLIVEVHNSTATPFVLGNGGAVRAAFVEVHLYKDGMIVEGRNAPPPDFRYTLHSIPPGGTFDSMERLSERWRYWNTLKNGLYRARIFYERNSPDPADRETKASLEKWVELEVVD